MSFEPRLELLSADGLRRDVAVKSGRPALREGVCSGVKIFDSTSRLRL